jgi:glutathione S-transferase
VPFLRIEENNWSVPESSIIIEYIDRHCPGGTKLIPDDPDLARQVRMRDRFFDLYVNDPMVKIFFDGFRPEGQKDPYGVQQAKDRLDTVFAMIDQEMAEKSWRWASYFQWPTARRRRRSAIAGWFILSRSTRTSWPT